MDEETRTYDITGMPQLLDILERVFGCMQSLGSVGASRNINIFVDGDGAARLKFQKNGDQLPNDDIHTSNGGYLITQSNGDIIVDLI